MGRTVPIRFNTEQLARVEEAAALAGYKHLSAYIRDRVLAMDKGAHRPGVEDWAEQQRMIGLLESIAQEQTRNRAILTVAIYLIRQNVTQGKVNELRAQLQHLDGAEDALAVLLPELANDIERLTGED
ncbi:hypothetical protein [Pseudomonas oryzihabitans]|uniref:hypothetical protein n=1 Tax=Pseudomonas oryzihabitans TaxID=47885 RepID=UPI00214F0590|nr:hypothetical protein [Pseudomonas psychrotolerans]UUW74400.1 hypothetical protein NRG74_23940 [Pseudomonas psychrotolerans]UUW74452.1 hypothetical protein NRG74_24215 [Pseudomonas psychrotolerans]